MKTIVYSGPGPSFKGVVRSPTERVFETEWLPDRERVQELCRTFIASYRPISEADSQLARQAGWDF